MYLSSKVFSVPSPTFINTSSMVVTDTPKLEMPSSALRAERKKEEVEHVVCGYIHTYIRIHLTTVFLIVMCTLCYL